jgi:hypothetical protein
MRVPAIALSRTALDVFIGAAITSPLAIHSP